MANSGRKPKPTIDIKVAKCSQKKVDLLEEKTPICRSQNFVAPDTLTKEELKVWNWLVKVLKSIEGSYIADADIMTMEIYCKCKVEYDKACKMWAKNPEYYTNIEIGKDKNGNSKYQIKVNQYYNIKRDYSMLLLKYSTELGITPSGRAKHGIQATKTETQKEKDKVLAIFNRSDD